MAAYYLVLKVLYYVNWPFKCTDCFNIGSNRVQHVCVTKDLGVHVCSDLSFATHVNTIAAMAHARACLIPVRYITGDSKAIYLLKPH